MLTLKRQIMNKKMPELAETLPTGMGMEEQASF